MIEYSSDARDVARALIGSILIRRLPGGLLCKGKIVETEAYPGPMDKASHAAGGRRTKRNNSMFLEGGHAYVYLIYGLYHCLNVSCGEEGFGAAVLIRAVEPLEGIRYIKKYRPKIKVDRDLCRGPGRLCKAFNIDLRHDGNDLRIFKNIWIEESKAHVGKIIAGPRVGLGQQNMWSTKPWRYGLKESPFVSSPSIVKL